MLTPDDVHHHRTRSVLDQRGRTLQAAWTRHPERFVRGIPQPDPLPQARLDQPTRDIHNRRDCSVNRNRQCLKVVDRFRAAHLETLCGIVQRDVDQMNDLRTGQRSNWRYDTKRGGSGQASIYVHQRPAGGEPAFQPAHLLFWTAPDSIDVSLHPLGGMEPKRLFSVTFEWDALQACCKVEIDGNEEVALWQVSQRALEEFFLGDNSKLV